MTTNERREKREKEVDQLILTGMSREEAVDFLEYWDEVEEMVYISNMIAA